MSDLDKAVGNFFGNTEKITLKTLFEEVEKVIDLFDLQHSLFLCLLLQVQLKRSVHQNLFLKISIFMFFLKLPRQKKCITFSLLYNF